MYKGFSLSQGSGFAAQEFDKAAPAPGLDWTGDLEVWFWEARAKGWVTKRSAQEAKVGAIIIGFESYPTGVWVGIVRSVKNDAITYETVDDKGKKVVLTKDFASLKATLLGYIWPQKVSTP